MLVRRHPAAVWARCLHGSCGDSTTLEAGGIRGSDSKHLEVFIQGLGKLGETSVRGQIYLHEQFLPWRVPFGENLPRSSALVCCELLPSSSSLEHLPCRRDAKSSSCSISVWVVCAGSWLVVHTLLLVKMWCALVGLEASWIAANETLDILCATPGGDTEASWQLWLTAVDRTFLSFRYGN